MKLGIVDLETGNIGSLVSAIKKLNINFKICKNNYDFEEIDKIILPGVGAFGDFMLKMRNKKIDQSILKKKFLKIVQYLVFVLDFKFFLKIATSTSYQMV